MCCALELTLVDKDAVTSFKFWSHSIISMVEELKKSSLLKGFDNKSVYLTRRAEHNLTHSQSQIFDRKVTDIIANNQAFIIKQHALCSVLIGANRRIRVIL